MNEIATPVVTEDDAAWASIATPLSVSELKVFCADVERLFRINPMLEFDRWESTGDNRYLFSGKNISQETPFDFEFELTVCELDDGYRFDYDRGIKSSTILKIEKDPNGSKLTITDRYDRIPKNEQEAHLHEVDKSIVIWAQYLQKFLVMWNRWSKYRLWRWYMKRVWEPMKPNARRITYMLLWITVVEIALILLAAGIFYVEFDRV
ncbi:MAG: hypothetical protein P8Y24_13960 [Gammaproteobacteria bacterium]